MMIALTAVAFSCSAMAKNTNLSDTTMHKMSTHTSMHKMSHKSSSMHKTEDCVMMMDNKMVCMKNGKTMPLTKTMTMTNGTKVMADGTVKMKDGKSMMLQNGHCVMMDGKVETMPMKKGMMKDKMKM